MDMGHRRHLLLEEGILMAMDLRRHLLLEEEEEEILMGMGLRKLHQLAEEEILMDTDHLKHHQSLEEEILEVHQEPPQ